MMINLIDIILLGVILIAGFVGYKIGFVKTVISFLSIFIALGLALAFYKPLAVILTENTEIDNWIEDKIMNQSISGDSIYLSGDETTLPATVNEDEADSQGGLLDNLPDIFSESLIDLETAKDNMRHDVAKKVSELVMRLLSLIIIYVVVKITLFIASIVLGGMMKLPVLKQLNEVLGMSLGAIIGFLNMYIAFAMITFISSITNIDFVIDAIKSSLFASAMFENNIIIRFLFN